MNIADEVAKLKAELGLERNSWVCRGNVHDRLVKLHQIKRWRADEAVMPSLVRYRKTS